MLQLLINGVSIDLPADISISLSISNPFLSKDSIPLPYSLDFELPPTSKNLEVFSYPNRLAIKDRIESYPCQILFEALVIDSGKLEIERVKDTISANFIGSSINNLEHALYKNDLGKVEFPGNYTTVDYNRQSNFAYHYKEWGANRKDLSEGDYVFAPVSIVNYNQPWSIFTPIEGNPVPDANLPKFVMSAIRKRYDNAFQLKKPSRSSNDEFVNPFASESDTFLREEGNIQYHPPLFPAFKVSWLLKKIIGDSLMNNLFESGSILNNLVIPTHYYPTWKVTEDSDVTENQWGNFAYPPMVHNPRPSPTDPYPGQPYIVLAEYLPDYKTNEFIIQLCLLFGITIVSKSGRLYMKFNNDILTADVKHNWSRKIIDGYEISFESGKNTIYKYKTKTTQSTDEDHISVASIKAMIEYPWDLSDQGTYNQLFFINNTGQYYTKTVNTRSVKVIGEGTTDWSENQINYQEVRDGFASDESSSSSREDESIECELIPMTNTPAVDFKNLRNSIVIEDRFGLVTPGIEVEDRTERPKDVHITLFKGEAETILGNDATYPYLSSYPDSILDLISLKWKRHVYPQGEVGLIERYHKEKEKWTAKKKLKISAEVYLTPLDFHNLDITDKVHIDGRNFFIEKIEVDLTNNGFSIAEIDFIEA